MRGKLVKTLVNSFQSSGKKTVHWNGTDSRDNTVSTGVYLYKINAGIFSQTKKMILLKQKYEL
jgi:flagellar hook assembly protein FlgD